MLRVFEFNSQILKSGVVVSSDDTQPGTGLLFVKGAHTAIKALIAPASLPPDFDEVALPRPAGPTLLSQPVCHVTKR